MAKQRYEQDPGNKRFRCPACKQMAILSVKIGPRDYLCPRINIMVTAEQVTAAKEERG